jgi:lysophospholipase L1-like esterase
VFHILGPYQYPQTILTNGMANYTISQYARTIFIIEITMKFVLLTISLCCSILLAEWIIRFTQIAPEVVQIQKWRMQLSSNPHIGYEPIPNLDTRGKSIQYYSYHGISNAMGFRDKDWQQKKPANTIRIALLGDSVAEGLWIEHSDDIFSTKLSNLLKQSGKKVEILNFAVSGYNTRQEVETFKEKALQFDPDIVLLAYCLNDTHKDDGHIVEHLLSEKKEKTSLYSDEISPLAHRSDLYRFIRYKALPSLGYIRSHTIPEQSLGHLGDNTVPEAFSILSKIVTTHDIEVIVAIFPDFTRIDEGIYKNEFSKHHSWVKELALENNFKVVDLFDGFVECKKKYPHQFISFDRYHMRPLGHTCAAELLHDHLIKLLPSGS